MAKYQKVIGAKGYDGIQTIGIGNSKYTNLITIMPNKKQLTGVSYNRLTGNTINSNIKFMLRNQKR